MKAFSPAVLHKLCVRDCYDVEISYLEGPSARIISGCQNLRTKLISWIHVEQHTMKKLSSSFRSEFEAKRCYEKFDHTVCVSKYVMDDFCSILDFKRPISVLYNTVESERIRRKAKEPAEELKEDGRFRMIAVGTLKESKGYMRLLRIINQLQKEHSIHLYVLGMGPLQVEMENYIQKNKLQKVITLLGYQTNPYRFVDKCDLFLCASFAEGFSTAVTEALILGTPVCTVDVSGMKELLGNNNEYGLVTDNSEEALLSGIRKLLQDRPLLEYYRKQARLRGQSFETERTVIAVQNLILDTCGD